MNTATISRKICFISHNATRTGAPIVLYKLVRWIKEHQGDQVEVWFLEGGEMIEAFEALCNCVVLKTARENTTQRLIKGVARRVLNRDVQLEQKLKRLSSFDLVFFNTVASFKIIPVLPRGFKPVCIAWLHEQPFSINAWYKKEFTTQHLSIFKQIFTVSTQTKVYLETRMGVPADKLCVVYPFIDVQHETDSKDVAPEDGKAFIVGGCGLQDWRKGPDLFLQVAKHIEKISPGSKIQFIWVGAESGLTGGLNYELEKLQLQGKVLFAGEQKNVRDWFNSFDVFLLTSREDPFPLVVLEAMALEKPVVCFEGIGDITKLVEVIPSNVVPYSDVDAMAGRVLNYYEKSVESEADGLRLKKEVSRYMSDEIVEEFYKKIIYSI
jgi:glycosyltransferase involved in cell wall biosynthesis